jgi:hypothetical protein
MSASQQHHINAVLQEQLQLLAQKCEFLANAHNETLERLKKLEAANEALRWKLLSADHLTSNFPILSCGFVTAMMLRRNWQLRFLLMAEQEQEHNKCPPRQQRMSMLL